MVGLAGLLRKHLAKHLALFNRVVEGNVAVFLVGEPATRKSPFGRFPVTAAKGRHCVSFHIECGKGKRALSGKFDHVPIHEKKIEAGGIGDEHGRARELLHPLNIALHRGGRFQRVNSGYRICLGIVFSEGIGSRVWGSIGEGDKIGREGRYHLAALKRGGAEGQHRIRAGDRAIGFNICADISFSFICHSAFHLCVCGQFF